MRLIRIALSIIALFCCCSVTVLAANKTVQSPAQLQAEIRTVSHEAAALQQEVASLRAALQQMEAQKAQQQARQSKVQHAKAAPKAHRNAKKPKRHAGKASTKQPMMSHKNPWSMRFPIFRHPVTVTTSPFLGYKTAFNAADLLTQASTMNEDLALLRHRQQLQHHMLLDGYSLNDRPVIELSGGLEGQALLASGFGGATDSINLTTAELDINGIASSWASGFISFEFDDSPASTGSRVPNSRIYLRRGFLTIGNLDVSPVYLTIGQMYVPFGRYASDMLTAPPTLSLMRTRVRALLVGVAAGDFYGEIYGFTGNQTTGTNVLARQGGINFGFKGDTNWGNFDVGSGAISTISDSEGMQNNGIPLSTPPLFRGFGEPIVSGGPTFNNLRHRVPGIDVHSEVTVGRVTLIGEYISGLRHFSPLDLTFNQMPALPSALYSELDYGLTLWNRHITLAIGYGRTWESLALNLPQQSFFGLISTSIWKDTIESIEYRHDIDYSSADIATGGTAMPGPGSLIIVQAPIRGTGKTRNMVTFQIGVYF